MVIGDCIEMNISYTNQPTFCAMDYEHEGEGVCEGGFGGGLLSPHFEVIGVLSKGSVCASQGQPGIYTEVYSHKMWIENVMNIANYKLGFNIFVLSFCVIQIIN